jgi:hypothetical protein
VILMAASRATTESSWTPACGRERKMKMVIFAGFVDSGS